jgi:hypothetical protein
VKTVQAGCCELGWGVCFWHKQHASMCICIHATCLHTLTLTTCLTSIICMRILVYRKLSKGSSCVLWRTCSLLHACLQRLLLCCVCSAP